MKAAVLGIGRMGSAISWAMKKLDFDIVGADSWEKGEDNFKKQVPNGIFYLVDENSAHKQIETALAFEKPDIVISSLPYHQTETIAHWCIDNGFRYCDLGGRVDVSKNINKYASEKGTKPVFTDLGLAPGWINILAEQGYKEIHHEVEEVEMMVGGIPGIPMNPPLNYSVTWSMDGLINEYLDDCEVLINGEIKTVAGMTGLETVHLDNINEDMEAFFTSGGASHTIRSMRERGVKNCFYKTIRWPGHGEAMDFLVRKCELSEECLFQIFKNGCKHDGNDVVLMRALVKGGSTFWKEEKIIAGDIDGTFSAMQKATAFPISSVAAIMAEGFFDGDKDQRKDYHTQYPKSLSYSDIPFDNFNKNLTSLLET